MRVQDLIKLVSGNYFKIFRINRITEDRCILKIFENIDCPKWNVLLIDCTYQEGLEEVRRFRSEGIYPILVSDRITTFDLVEMVKKDFVILQEEEDDEGAFLIKEFCTDNLSWKTLETFETLSERNVYLNFRLLDPRLICI